MSWDVWIINSKDKTPMDEIDESLLEDFGELDVVIEKMAKIIPKIDWTDKTYPHLDNGDYRGHIGLNVTEDNRCDSIMFHVYGGDNPTKTITDVCRGNNWLAIDTTTGQYLDLKFPDKSGWNEFKDFRKSIQNKVGGESPVAITRTNKKWWEFWK